MKGHFLIALPLALIVAAFAAGQDIQNGGPNWEALSPANEEFKIETPVKLRVSGNQDEKSSRRYLGSDSDTFYYIFSDTGKVRANVDMVIKFAAGNGKEFGGAMLPTERREVEFEDDDGWFHRIVIIGTNARRYAVQTISRSKDDKEAKRFIRSFELETGRLLPGQREDAAEVAKKGAGEMPPSGPGKRGSGSGTGSGSGNRVGWGGSNRGAQSPIDATVSAPLRIITKPKPSYTDFARFYEISGTVILRVAFMASGEIGSISIVKGLPLGLPIQAIAAARGLRFEPAVEDGKPTTVTKQVEYTFAIY